MRSAAARSPGGQAARRSSAASAMRRRARPLLAAILPVLVLRALIPFGFMPVAGSGGPAMALCPGAEAMGAAPFGHQHHGTGSPGGSAHALCAFAASAAPAVAPVAPAMPLAAACLNCAVQTNGCSIRLPSILRTQYARAPPSVA
jgi:hypothetical protein